VTTTVTKDDIRRFRANLQGELDGIAVYRAMSEAEKNPPLKVLYGRLADNEVKHAAVWEQKLRDAGVDMASPEPVETALAHFEQLVAELDRLL